MPGKCREAAPVEPAPRGAGDRGGREGREGVEIPSLSSVCNIRNEAHPESGSKVGQNGGGVAEGEKAWKLGQYRAYYRRVAFALFQNVKGLLKHGEERVGFLTVTFRDHVLDGREASRRLHSLRTGVLKRRYPDGWVGVRERQKSGRVHYHFAVVCSGDIRSGADFEAFGRGDYRSANLSLRGEWAFWRKTAPAYGFGRTELLPCKKGIDAVAGYVGKYLGKHVGHREEADRGARLTLCSAGARVAQVRFTWSGGRSSVARRGVGVWARNVGCRTFEQVSLACRRRFGRRWAFVMYPIFLALGGD